MSFSLAGKEYMGKNLKGKEIGKGICQRKDGYYVARFCNQAGKREEKYFRKLPEAKAWLEEAKYADKHSTGAIRSDISVDDWFDTWLNSISKNLASNTIDNYRTRYIQNIQPLIGRMNFTDVKPLHCQQILNEMTPHYAKSTIIQTYITMGTMLKSAVLNDMIPKHPMDGIRFNKPVRSPDDIKYFTIDEQKRFQEAAKRSRYYHPYLFVLETGLRTGELTGLTWNDIDFENKTLTVDRSVEYSDKDGGWRAGPPKTLRSYRTIPLTRKAYEILYTLYQNRFMRKESAVLAQTLHYTDKRNGRKKSIVMRDMIFINPYTGEPVKNSTYDSAIYKICDNLQIERSHMHALRHTYATRAIERGVSPKVLQMLLGHDHVQTTMDRYVHVTDDSLRDAVNQFEGFNDFDM